MLRNKDSGSSFSRYVKSFCHAIDGIVASIKYEHNMIIMLIATVLVVFMGIYFNIKIYEWLFCISIIGAIFASELINTAIEALVDLDSFEINPLAKFAKDAASGATLILCVVALIGSLIIFIPYI